MSVRLRRLAATAVAFGLLLVAFPVLGEVVEADPPEKEGASSSTGDEGDTRPECADCGGTGEALCAECSGKKRVPGSCSECTSGRKDCSYCDGGKRTCWHCDGTGKKTASSVSIRQGRRIVTRYSKKCGSCGGQTKIRCESCYGRGDRDCLRCTGGTVNVECPTCDGSGKEPCVRCAGEGRVGLPPVEPPVVPLIGHERELERESLLRRRARIQEVRLRFARADGELQQLRPRFDQLQEELFELEGRPELDTPTQGRWLRDRLDTARKLWEACDEAIEEIAGPREELLRRNDQAEEQLDALELAIERLDAPDLPEADPPPAGLEFTIEYKSRLSDLDAAAGSLSRKIAAFENAIKSHREAYDRIQKQVRDERREQETLEAAFTRFLGAFLQTGIGRGLPDAAVTLVDTRSKNGALTVQVEYRDTEAPAAERPEQVEPTEKYLRLLPELLTRSFNAGPEIERIIVHVMGQRMSPTGHSHPSRIQMFSAERDQWQELTTGAFQDDRKKQLSKIAIHPAYPRPGFATLRDSMPSVALALILIFAACMVMIIRAWMS